jgi:hypothetical protein
MRQNLEKPATPLIKNPNNVNYFASDCCGFCACGGLYLRILGGGFSVKIRRCGSFLSIPLPLRWPAPRLHVSVL